MGHGSVKFNGATIAFVGVIAGVAIAIAVPYMALVYGQSLGQVVVTIVVLAALCIGGAISLVAAFFGAVIPTTVEESKKDSGVHQAVPAQSVQTTAIEKTTP
jgi:ABC-type branched-subunit amino acid transport system permease subunit